MSLTYEQVDAVLREKYAAARAARQKPPRYLPVAELWRWWREQQQREEARARAARVATRLAELREKNKALAAERRGER
jgi:hypothetical protein